ncbi:MAG: GNAT family N-acetyltransferase [Candidatus Kariarchaeaceae archaeon]|jgi:RimJ/RimL family protein N-acetyltransferase
MVHPILLDIPSELESERLIVRSYQAGDGPEFFRVLRENKDHLEEFVNEVKKIKSEEEAEIRNRKLLADFIGRTRFVMGIWEKQSNSLIGEIWIESIIWDVKALELGYFVVKKYEGKGLVSEAVKRSVKFLFEDLKVNKVEIHTNDTNVRSYGVAERCGFTKEAHLRERVKTSKGEVVGRLYYGMLKKEYEDLFQSE